MRQNYTVTLTFQFPAWDEKDGIAIVVSARSKSEAIKYARAEFERAGHIGGGARQGRVTLRAVEGGEIETDNREDRWSW